jgi:hypothetical protein
LCFGHHNSKRLTSGCWQRRELPCWFTRSPAPAAPDPCRSVDNPSGTSG